MNQSPLRWLPTLYALLHPSTNQPNSIDEAALLTSLRVSAVLLLRLVAVIIGAGLLWLAKAVGGGSGVGGALVGGGGVWVAGGHLLLGASACTKRKGVRGTRCQCVQREG